MHDAYEQTRKTKNPAGRSKGTPRRIDEMSDISMAPSTTPATCARATNIDGTYSQRDPTYTGRDRIIRYRKMTSLGELTRVIHRAYLDHSNAEGPAKNEPAISQRGLIQPRGGENLTLGVSNRSNSVPRNTLKSTAPSYLRPIQENSSAIRGRSSPMFSRFQVPEVKLGWTPSHLHPRQSVSVPTL